MKSEKLVTSPLIVVVPNTAFGISCHWFCAFVLSICGTTPAGIAAGSNGSVTVTGTANVVPCGVNANVVPND